MAMFYGLATFGAGILLGWREGRAFWSAARSLAALHLMLIGGLVALVGLSERRAQAQYEAATREDAEAKAA